MTRLLMLVTTLCLVTACGDSDKETDAEYQARARAADVAAADGTIARIPDGTEPISIEPRPANLSNHPLSQFFNAYGFQPLKYIGRFWLLCDTNHTAYIEKNCGAAVERAIRVGKSIGIRLTRDDLLDPAYWEFISTMHLLRLKHRQDYMASLGRKSTLTDLNTYNKEFRATVIALMANMGDK